MQKNLSKLTILLTIMLMDILTGMEFDLFVPSFPELQSHFNLSPFWVEAALSANFIGYCLSLVFMGDLSDRFGRKPLILFGLSLFVIGSVVCLFPPSYPFFLGGRLIQGIGIAAPAILSFLIIADEYPLKEQQFLMAMLNGSLNIAVGVAPIIGSYVTLYFHWQGNFALLLMLGVIVFLMTALFIPSAAKQQREATSLHGLHGYLEIFQSKPLILLISGLLFLFIPYWVFVGMSPLLYIKALGISLAHFGYYQGILALVFAIGSILFGLILKTYNYTPRQYLNLSLILLITSLVIILLPTFLTQPNALLITLSLLPFIIAQVIPTTILYPLCLNYIPHAKGRISAILQGARLILTAISLQIAGYLYTGTFQNIGVILIGFMVAAIICLYLIIHNQKIMRNI